MKQIKHKDLVLSYQTFGTGTKAVLCFHGHGKSHLDFSSFSDLKDSTLYSFDLFGHGKSPIPQKRLPKHPLSIQEFKTIFTAFLKEENLSSVHLMAYSLGGKLALNFISEFSEKVKSIILFAPDGLKEIPWYTYTSKSRLLQKMYHYTIQKPNPFLGFVRATHFLRIIPNSLFKFLNYQFETKERRFLSYQTWVFYRVIFPKKNRLTSVLSHQKTNVLIIVGQYDQVIKTKYARYFKNSVYSETQIVELPIGHDFFKPKNLEKVKSEIIKSNYL